jgi:general stress protein 26
MPDSREDAIKQLVAIIKDIKFAMLTTVHNDGSLHSRPMAKPALGGGITFGTGRDTQ